jgi:hypothetical protein
MDKKVLSTSIRGLGLKLHTRRTFGYIEKVYINKVNTVKMLGGPRYSPEMALRNTNYKCFLKFDDGDKMFLDEDSDKERLITRLRSYNKLFKTSIFDQTAHDVIVIESLENT